MEAFEDMQVAGVKPDVVTFSSLIKACQACGNRWKTAMGYLKRMSAEGGPFRTRHCLDRPYTQQLIALHISYQHSTLQERT